MLNESLCDPDKQKQAHLCQVDFYLRKLFSFNRLGVDVFVKLEALRTEDESNDRKRFLKTVKKFDSTDNFFMEEEELQDNATFEDVNINEDGDMEVLENRQLR
jgi:hypothetical protein